MIDAALNNFLETALNAEKYKLYIDIISYLESIEYDTIESELLDIIFSPIGDEDGSEEKPENMILDECHGHLRECLISQLSQMGVVLTDEILLSDTLSVCQALVEVQNYEDMSSLVAAAYTDGAAIDRLTEVLQLVTTESADHWAHLLESVSPQLIRKIVVLSKEEMKDQYAEMQALDQYIDKLRIYQGFCQSKESMPSFVDKIGSLIPGQPFEVYIDSGDLGDLFEGNEMRALGFELYGMALLSSDAKDDPVGAIRSTIDKYLGDLTRITKLNSEISLINSDFVKYYQTAMQTLGM